MKILLTGPRGNLGQALMQLGTTHEWLTLDRTNWSDLAAHIGAVDFVIHAASDLLTPIAQHPIAVMDSNIMTTARLLEAWPQKSRARLLFTSSCAVYGRSHLTSEDVDSAPISINGLSKLINEKMIQEFCLSRDIEFQIVRTFNIYGGSDHFSILAHLKRAITESRAFTIYNEGVSQRDFVHVHDVATLILQLLQLPVRYNLLNLGSGETTRIADIVGQVHRKYPDLKVMKAQRLETEYSRAEISRLRELFPNYKFRDLLDFIRRDL